jgi:hypothetical protein
MILEKILYKKKKDNELDLLVFFIFNTLSYVYEYGELKLIPPNEINDSNYLEFVFAKEYNYKNKEVKTILQVLVERVGWSTLLELSDKRVIVIQMVYNFEIGLSE